MANRYWGGGTGTWSTIDTTHWYSDAALTTLAGAVPTAADNVFFQQATTYTVTCTGALVCLDLTVSAGIVTFATGTTPTFGISGSMSLVAATVWSSTGRITFNATTTGKTITTNGVTFSSAAELSGVGGEWTLGSAFTSGAFTLTAGNLVTNNFAVTFPNFISTSTSVRGLNLGSSLVTVTLGGTSTIWNVTNTANLSVTGTSTISCTASTGKVFSGGSGVAYYNIDQGGAGYLQIAGTAIFNDIQNSYVATGATSIRIQGSPITLNNFTATGAEGKVLTLISSAGATTKILTKLLPGIVSVDYMLIQDITATGSVGTGVSWYAGTHSVDQGNNTGWIFSGIPNLLTRLFDTGIFRSNNTISLDEVTKTTSNISTSAIYSSMFDEVSQSAVPMRILQNGNMQVSGSFDEVTGMIVTNGLVAYYDAGLAASQPSDGIWHDISDFGNPVTASVSPPTYNSSGYFTFDRVNTQRFQLDALNITSWTDPWTIETWMFTPTGATWSDGTNLSHFISVGVTDGSWGLIRGSVNNQTTAWIRYGAITTAANATLSRDVWNQVVARWDPVLGILSMYVNGQLVDSSASITPTGVPDTSLMSIGGANNTLSGSPGIFYEGNIAAVILYNRALSSAEVDVNFQALRNRFRI